MELQTKKSGRYFIILAKGRLDANWADYFAETFMGYIRKGEHQLVVDARHLVFLSSAGIRSLIKISKELAKVNGSFLIVHATDFVAETLQTTGLGQWLSGKAPEGTGIDYPEKEKADPTRFLLNKDARMLLRVENKWKPWQSVREEQLKEISFKTNSFALGIGSPKSDEQKTAEFGEFLVVCGNLVYQPPESGSRPDFLLPVADYIPEIRSIQTLYCEGEMSHLLRFAPEEQKGNHKISDLAQQALTLSQSKLAAFVILAEIDGLVGAYLTKSPSGIDNTDNPRLSEMREMLSYSSERVFTREQALVFGIAGKEGQSKNESLLRKIPSKPGLTAHIHAVVFPYQPLQNGKLDIKEQMDKFFNGPPPKALMHLVEDNRPVQGLGESAFIRGAMWCSAVQNKDEEL